MKEINGWWYKSKKYSEYSISMRKLLFEKQRRTKLQNKKTKYWNFLFNLRGERLDQLRKERKVSIREFQRLSKTLRMIIYRFLWVIFKLIKYHHLLKNVLTVLSKINRIYHLNRWIRYFFIFSLSFIYILNFAFNFIVINKKFLVLLMHNSMNCGASQLIARFEICDYRGYWFSCIATIVFAPWILLLSLPPIWNSLKFQ